MTAPAYYSVLSARVRYAPISAAAKILYSEITALSQAGGFCYAGNTYFAGLYNVTERQVRRWIQELQLLKVIRVETVNGQRRIYLLDDPLSSAGTADKNVREGRTKMSSPDKNVREGRTKMSKNADKNVRHNNINNITRLNKAQKAEQRRGTGPLSSGSAADDLLGRLQQATTPLTYENIVAAHVAGTCQFYDDGLTELSRAFILALGGEIISPDKRHNTSKGGAA